MVAARSETWHGACACACAGRGAPSPQQRPKPRFPSFPLRVPSSRVFVPVCVNGEV